MVVYTNWVVGNVIQICIKLEDFCGQYANALFFGSMDIQKSDIPCNITCNRSGCSWYCINTTNRLISIYSCMNHHPQSGGATCTNFTAKADKIYRKLGDAYTDSNGIAHIMHTVTDQDLADYQDTMANVSHYDVFACCDAPEISGNVGAIENIIVIPNLCAGVSCNDMCVGNDLYLQTCDPQTGNCLQGALKEANSIICTRVFTSIAISPPSMTIGIGSIQQFTATCIDQYGNIMTCPTITWNSDDTTIGTIDPNTGIFTAIAGGTVTIKATGGTVVGSTTVVVVTTGDLYILSTPPGAKIFIDDVEQIDLITPVTIYNLSPGTHNVRLTLSGSSIYMFGYRILSDYQWTGTVNIIAGQMAIIDIVLIPITGDININSDPLGAKIIIDDTDTGKITPDTIMGLSPGTHTYKLTLTGYVDTTGTFDIIAGQLSALAVTLDLAGYLYISSTPIGAKIFIDDVEQIGKTTPTEIYNLPIGTHTYKLSLAGYNDFTGSFDIIVGQIAIIEVILIPLVPVKGYLYISSTPLGAEIYIDNIDTGKVTPMIIPDLSPGNHNYKLVLPKYKDDIGTFDIVSDHITVIYKELIKLSVGCQPFGTSPTKSEIYIDNIDTTFKTPKPICHLPLGDHVFMLDGTFIIPPSPRPLCQSFDSVPRGAKIFIDDIDTGKVTPDRICNITSGTHTFSIRGIVKITK